MSLRIYTFLFLLTATPGCKTSDNRTNLYDSDPTPIEIVLILSPENPITDNKPSQFWLHPESGQRTILATRKSANGLTYKSGNDGIDLTVSPAAQQCMHEIIQIIEKSQTDKSSTWINFTKLHPYRFLEPLAELHDFYSNRTSPANVADKTESAEWLQPVLWNGFKSGSAGKPGDSGFKVRGYIKWRGVLLADGKTCLVTRPDLITDLLQTSMKCEAGEDQYCNFRTADL